MPPTIGELIDGIRSGTEMQKLYPTAGKVWRVLPFFSVLRSIRVC